MPKELNVIPSSNPTTEVHPPQAANTGGVKAAIAMRLVMNDVEAAEVLDMAPTTLRKWRTNGQGPSYLKLGKNVRYRMEDLTAYLQKQMVAR